MVGDDVELRSSSGLSTNNITVRFEYSLIYKQDVGRIKVATCEPNITEPKFVENWMILRSNITPFDCRLVILNATIEDSGYYESVGLLPNGDEYQYASSNIVELIVRVGESTLVPVALESSNISIFIAAMIVTFIGIMIAVLVIVVLIVRWRQRENRRQYNRLQGMVIVSLNVYGRRNKCILPCLTNILEPQNAGTGRPVNQPPPGKFPPFYVHPTRSVMTVLYHLIYRI